MIGALIGVAGIAFTIGMLVGHAVSYYRWLDRCGLAVCYQCDRTTTPRKDK